MAKANAGNGHQTVIKGITGSNTPTSVQPPRGGSVMASGSGSQSSSSTQGSGAQGNGQGTTQGGK